MAVYKAIKNSLTRNLLLRVNNQKH